jgi:hypothetical protein
MVRIGRKRPNQSANLEPALSEEGKQRKFLIRTATQLQRHRHTKPRATDNSVRHLHIICVADGGIMTNVRSNF